MKVVELYGQVRHAVRMYPSGEGRLYAEDLIVNIAGPGDTMIVSA